MIEDFSLSPAALTLALVLIGVSIWIMIFSALITPLGKLVKKPRIRDVVILILGSLGFAYLFSGQGNLLREISLFQAAPYIGVIVLGISLWVALFATLAILLEKPIQALLDSFWLPGINKRTKMTDPGVRLEMVLQQSKKATVWWDTPIWTVRLFLFSLLAPLVIRLGISLVQGWLDLASDLDQLDTQFGSDLFSPDGLQQMYAIFLVIVYLGPIAIYHLLRWKQRNNRLLIYTDEMIHWVGRPTIPGLFRAAEDSYISVTPTMLIEDVIATPDPEDIDPNYKTSFLRDWWTKRRYKSEDVLSLRLPSRTGGDDFFYFAEGGVRFINSRSRIRNRAQRISSERQTGESAAHRAEWLEYAETRNIAHAEELGQAELNISDALLRADAEPAVYDEAKEMDPGFWDHDGFEIDNKGTPIEDVPDELREVEAEFPEYHPGRPEPTQSVKELKEDTGRIIQELEEEWVTFYKRGRILEAGLNKDEAIALVVRCGISLTKLANLIGQGLSVQEIRTIYLSEDLAASSYDQVSEQSSPDAADQSQAVRPSALSESSLDLESGNEGNKEGLPRRRPSPNTDIGREKPSQLRE